MQSECIFPPTAVRTSSFFSPTHWPHDRLPTSPSRCLKHHSLRFSIYLSYRIILNDSFFYSRASEKLAVSWPKRVSTTSDQPQSTEFKNITAPRNFTIANATSVANMTRPDLENVTSVLITKIMDGIRNDPTTENPELKKNESNLPLCDDGIPSDFGKNFRQLDNFCIIIRNG